MTMEDQLEQASNIIISALGDHALRVVRSIVCEPREMIAKLYERYNSKSTANRISKMVQLMSIKFVSIHDDISEHIYRLTELLEQLQSMGTMLDNTLSVGILVASIQVAELAPVTAATKTLAESDLKWESVRNRLIEKTQTLTSRTVSARESAVSSSNICGLWSRRRHQTKNCFFNSLNPKIKLKMTNDGKFRISNSNNKKTGRNSSDKTSEEPSLNKNDNNNTPNPAQRAAMARPGAKSSPDRMLMDSDTTSHMTNRSDRVQRQQKCDTSISLAGDSTVHSTSKGIRIVHWNTENGFFNIILSDTLFASKIATSLLSVPALVMKNIPTLLLLKRAIMFDMDDDYKELGQATQYPDCLYYIDDPEHRVSKPLTCEQ